MSNKLKVINNIKQIFYNNCAYLIWNINQECWFRPESYKCKICKGVWVSEEDTIEDINKYKLIAKYKLKDYEILEIKMEKIHKDLIRIANLGKNFFESEKKQMIFSKLRQLFIINFFWNDNMLKIMKEKYKNVISSNSL